MHLVKGYALAAALSLIVAFMSGPETPRLVFWLYIVGAATFALAAFGQYKKEQKKQR
jgi:hypothetical protein